MNRKDEFLKGLEELCKKFDTEQHETEIYLDTDGEDSVISVYLPDTPTSRHFDFILSSRPYA